MARLRTRPRRAPALVLALAAVAAGCTGDDDAGGSTSAPTVADPSTPPPTAPGSGTGPSAPGTDPASTAPSTSAAAPSGVACGSLPLATATDATLAALVATTPDLSALTGLLDAAGLTERLSEPGPVTLIAPTNAAFDALDPATRDALEADPTGVLARVLGLHLVEGAHPMADLVSGGPVSGPAGTITASVLEGRTVIDAGGGPATVGCQDVATTNGVLHVVDRVLLPPPVDTEAVGGSRLYRVDPGTGAATPLGAFGEELGVLDVVAVDDATLLALTDGGELVTFDPAAPSSPIARVPISGVEGATLLALDAAADGVLLGVTDQSGVYRIDPATGVASAVGGGLDPGVDDLGVAADVGPDGLLRLVVATGLDVAVDGRTGAVTATGPAPAFVAGDPHADVAARVVAIASTSDGLLAVEGTTASLARLGAEGALTTIGPLGAGLTDGAGLDATPDGTLYLTVPG